MPVYSAYAQTAEKPQSTAGNPGSAEKPSAEKAEKASEAEKKENEQATFEQLLKEELEGNPVADETERPSWGMQFFKTTVVLIIMLGLFYGGYRLYMFRKKMPGPQSSVVNVLLDFPLGTDNRLQIVEMANRLLVLGVSSAGVNLITEIREPEDIDQIKIASQKDSEHERPDFFLELSRAIRDRVGSTKSTDTSKQASDLPWEGMRNLSREKLMKMKRQRDLLRGHDD